MRCVLFFFLFFAMGASASNLGLGPWATGLFPTKIWRESDLSTANSTSDLSDSFSFKPLPDGSVEDDVTEQERDSPMGFIYLPNLLAEVLIDN
jgi:hypothetical protein